MLGPLPTRVWHLAMDDAAALRPPARPNVDLAVVHAEVPLAGLNRWMYAEIGRDHGWIDRLVWDEARWQAHVDGVETWLALLRGTPAGMAELVVHPDGTVEVYVFGVLPAMQGRGVGGGLLSAAIARGWALGAPRMSVQTCELDGPGALPNYLARGFTVREERIEARRRPGCPVARVRDARDEDRAALGLDGGGGDLRVAVGEDGGVLGASVVARRPDGAWALDQVVFGPGAEQGGVGRVLVNDVLGRARAAGAVRVDGVPDSVPGDG